MRDELAARQTMRPFGRLTRFHVARRAALELCHRVRGSRALPLFEAGGRVVAADVTAGADIPATDRAAMDGYAVIAADVQGDREVVLEPAGSVLAGDLGMTSLTSGSCCEVATGARLPQGADAVVPVEQTRRENDRIVVLRSVSAGAHVSRRGEDLAAGDVVVAAGELLTPSAAAALASIGVADVEVVRRPRVLLMPTGDELVPVGEELQPGQVYDSNSIGIQLLLEAQGAVVERTPIVRDDPNGLIDALRRSDVDLVVTLGGTSVGRHDLVLDVVGRVGAVHVHGVAIKPGKPVLIADIDARPLIGLPGFPTSCLFTGYLFAEPMVRKLAGLPVEHRRRAMARLAEEVTSPADKLQFLTVEVRDDEAIPVYRASSTITSMSRAHGWIEVAENIAALPAGSPVEVTFF